MKNHKKLLSVFLAMLLAFGCLSISVCAVSTTQDGLEVTLSTDKRNYRQGEQITATLTVTNNNKDILKNLSLNNLIPKGYKLADDSVISKQAYALEAEDTVTLTTVFIADLSVVDGNDDHTSPNDNNTVLTNNITSNEIESIPKTGEKSTVMSFILTLILLSLAIIIVLSSKNKTVKKILSILLCFTVLGGIAIQGDFIVNAAETTTRKAMISSPIVVNGAKINMNSYVTYLSIDNLNISDEDNPKYLIEPVTKEVNNILYHKDGISHKEFLAQNPVTSVDVIYELKNGTGIVNIRDITTESYMSSIPGAVSSPVEITVAGDEVEAATISFEYDRSKLKGVNENDLGICWYDEGTKKVVLLNNTDINTKEQTVSVTTSHFSKYIVVDTVQWYAEWAKEQLVVRDDGVQTPYYNIIFALDSSGSMSGSKNTLCRQATLEFVKLLKDKDKISIMSFADNTNVYMENQIVGKTSMADIERCINQIGASGSTNYQAGLDTALSLIIAGQEEESGATQDGISRQSLLVFLSDGEPTTNYSQETLEQLKYLAETANCRCVTIGLGYVNDYYLKEMATAGNGEYMYVDNADQLPALFEKINDWYVGSTKDTDGDGLPDIVETTGMRTEYGYFVRTDPNNADTDGDGINDGKEMGTFVYQEDGSSYFIINSHPDIPTNYSNESKVTVDRIDTLVGQSEIPLTATFEDIEDWFSGYRTIVSLRAKKIEIANDFLSETVYKDALVNITADQWPKCAEKGYVSHSNHSISAGQEVDFVFKNLCQKNLLKCKNNHLCSVNIVNQSGTVDSSNIDKIQENPKTKWEEIVKLKLSSVMAEYNTSEAKMSDKSFSIFKRLESKANQVAQERMDKVNKAVETQLGIDPNLPETARVAFLDCYYKEIERAMKTNFSSYKNVKNSADLVNKVSREIETEKGKIYFTDPKTKIKYVCEYDIPAKVWGAAFITGNIINQKTNKKYTFGGTRIDENDIEREMGYLKEFADLKIEEAQKAIFSDTFNLLYPKELRSFIKELLKSDILYALDDYERGLGTTFEKLSKSVKKFEDVKDAYFGIINLDFSKADAGDITSKITKYNKSMNTWIETIQDL